MLVAECSVLMQPSYAEVILRSTFSSPGSARNTSEKESPESGMLVGLSEAFET